MVKAAALKFFTMFRNDIPRDVTVQLLPYLIRFLGAESNVVTPMLPLLSKIFCWSGMREGKQDTVQSIFLRF